MKHKIKIAFILAVEFLALATVLVLIFFAGKKQYTVTFDLNGGTLLSGNLEQHVTQGSNATPPSAYKEGHYLRGWSGSYQKVTGNSKVTAVWEYVTTSGIEYDIKKGATYTEISGCFKALQGKVYIGAYHDNLIVFAVQDSAFEDCFGITDVHMLDGVITIGNRAFAGCTSLTDIDLPNTAISIGDEAFENCKELKKITLPKSLQTLGENVFAGCESLEEIYIPTTVRYIPDNAFAELKNLKKVVFVDYESKDAADEDENERDESENTDEETEEKIIDLKIGANAFAGCESLEEITLPENLSYIGRKAFAGCSALKEITLPDSLSSIDAGAFAGCTSLTYIVIPESVKLMGDGVFDTEILIYTYIEEDGEFPAGFTDGWYTGNATLVYGYNGEDIVPDSEEEVEEAE